MSTILDEGIRADCSNFLVKLTKKLEQLALKIGAVKPLSRKVFQKDEVETVFRYMAAGKHIGKVSQYLVLYFVQEEDNFVNAPILALPRYYCPVKKTYVILSGLGGFGLELADWLVIRAEMLAPVDAIFNLAIVLNDKPCQNHTAETFHESFKAKAWATKNLDQLSRKICPQFRYVVAFSSVSCGRGNAGQTNYSMTNSIMERICERRSRESLHGLEIQWNAVGDVSIIADMMNDGKEIIIGGTLQQKISSYIEKLEEFLLQEHPIVVSMVVAEKRSSSFGATDIADSGANIMGEDHIPDVLVDLPTKQNNAKYDVFLLPGMEGCGTIFNPLLQKIEASATCIHVYPESNKTDFLQNVQVALFVGQLLNYVVYTFLERA
ncbi:hypothetical protein DMN91_002812 [Ooceraea biroi]|uniref:Ketoreductase domain-containing protein n=1 Tax=Ooceraea biroi TaxID=2015173 RepID=A0A3L8DWQ0_OOCBI|nr:hypothetical protein DMN91_002812 [Ooceraea biroi]